MIWRGLAIGIIISAPMGPVGILCVQRTLEKGRLSGFFTGVGASISDLFYCILTGFGLSFIEEFLKANQAVIQTFGSLVLILFGIYLFRSHPARQIKKPDMDRTSKGKNVLGGFLFTVSNPLIIFLIIGLFARFDFFLPEISFGLYVIGYLFIIIGALLWWSIVSFFVDKLRAHFNLRSMWLINKITGGIIMIFAIVGIITAFSSSASANEKVIYLNSSRGFGNLDSSLSPGSPLVIENSSSDTIYRFIPVKEFGEFTFKFRGANLNNKSAGKYSYTDSRGDRKSVLNPAWGIALKSSGKTASFTIATVDPVNDSYQSPHLNVCYSYDNCNINRKIFDNFDLFIGDNSYMISNRDGKLALSGGNIGYNLIFENLVCDETPDSIGFFICPGAKLRLDDISLAIISTGMKNNGKWSHFSIEDVRNSYFSRSSDRMEGEWEIFDRQLDDDAIRMGGNYRLACVRSGEDYDLVLIDGAQKNSDKWESGMQKAALRATSFNNVYDVIWFDPSGRELNGEIKAQFTSPDILTFHFPEHGNSTLRLRKIKY